jgi:hypothetical protein
MSNDKVEDVMAALDTAFGRMAKECEAYVSEREDDVVKVDGYVNLRALARAAIEAMREPTKAMIEAGASGSGEDSEDVATGAWESMIDVALKP